MKRGLAIAAIAAALATTLAGCGSTVTLGSTGQVGATSDGLGVTPDSQAGQSTPDTDTSSSDPRATSATDGSSDGDPLTSSPTDSPTEQAAASVNPGISIPLGPGVTATTITIAATYYESGSNANKALGANIDTGDPVASSRILIDHINKTGGIAGRQVKLSPYAVDPQSSVPYATQAQQVCTRFTQDIKVIAVINGTPAADFRDCLGKHGVAVFSGSILGSELAPNEFAVMTVVQQRAYAALVPSLQSLGWFSGWDIRNSRAGSAKVKVGIVMVDAPEDNRAVNGVLIPALRRAGHAPDNADVIRITPPQGFGDTGNSAAAIQNAVLKLNSHQVSHVILDDSNASLSLFFNTFANTQGYFPRYAGTSGNGWQVLLSSGSLPKRTLNGAMGIGWLPLFDVPVRGNGDHANAARLKCFDIYRKAGMPATDGVSAAGQATSCDVAFFIRAGLDAAAKRSLTLAGLTEGVNGLGRTFASASSIGTSFSKIKHDGAGTYLGLAFDSGCECFTYKGAVKQFG